jgi:WD40 repeat protein/DNA-binding SARP family transcriptional activator
MATSRLEFRLLGPLTVTVDGVPIAVGGPKQRALLALLLLSANRVVPRERLIDELFADQGVNSADHALRNHVSRLRKALAPVTGDEPRLAAQARGYLLRVESEELDLERFELLVAEGREALRAGDPESAARLLREGEALWRGRPLADLELERLAGIEAERLEELRLAAVEERIDAELALGRHLPLVAELDALGADYPFRERFQAQLMIALYRSGRQADGLEVYRQTRNRLNHELGLEPGLELQQLERAILTQDPALTLRADPQRGAPRPRLDICPYKGLAQFEPGDAEFFFGRERLVEELVARLADVQLLAVVGPSGSGKSSVLRAGLLPALARDWLLVRPGERTAAELVAALESVRPGDQLVLAVDQLEELFASSVDVDERRAFVDALVDAAWDPGRRAVVLLALRADFFGHVARHPELADLVGPNHVLLGPPTRAELRRAIDGPADRAGLEVEPALVDALVDDVAGEPGGLPLLSTALVDLWTRRDGRALALAAYEQTGGVRGAVARHAESAFGALPDDDRDVGRRILLRLVSTGGGDEPPTRRRAARSEFDAEHDPRVERVLSALVRERLLVADDTTVELVHEALLDHWPRLERWLDENAHGRRLHRQLTDAASSWDASGRDAGELYRGARLAAALEWAEATGTDAGLNQLEREFLQASHTASTRATRRLRALLAAALVLLVAALIAGAVALQARGTARHRATAAIAQRLGAQALVEPALDRALLLAREGVELDDSVPTRSNLLGALLRSPAALTVLHGGGTRVQDAALGVDGRMLAVRGDDGSVAFFDLHTLREHGARFQASGKLVYCGAIGRPVHAMALSPDGHTLAVGDQTSDGLHAGLTLVDTRSHRATTSRVSPRAATEDVVFAPDGRHVVTGEAVTCHSSPPQEVLVARSAADGRVLGQSRPIAGGRLIGFTRDGSRLLVASGEAVTYLLDGRTFARVRTFAVGGMGALSPAADMAAFGRDDGTVTFLDLPTGKVRPAARRATGRVLALAFSHDGKVLATSSDDGSVYIWDVPSGRLRERFTGHAGAAVAPLFSPDGTTLATGSSDGGEIVWDVLGERRLGRPFRFGPVAVRGEGGHEPAANASTAVAVSPDGSLFATSPSPGRVTLWRNRDQTVVRELRGPFGYVVSLAFSHDGRLLAATGNAPNTVVWNVATRRIVRILHSPVSAGAAGVAFSPSDELVATAGLGTPDDPGLLRIYELASGRLLGNVRVHGTLQDLDFSSDGKLLASAGLDGDVLIWNVTRRHLQRTIPSRAAIFTIRFAPDGRTVATGGISGTVDFWNAADGRRAAPPLGDQNGPVISVSYDPTGRELVTTSADGKLRLWDLRSRKLVGAPLPGSDVGGWGTFFADGGHAIAVFPDGTGVVWNTNPHDWQAHACRVAHRTLTEAEWRDFLPERTYRPTCP